jgi:hypothetical protein
MERFPFYKSKRKRSRKRMKKNRVEFQRSRTSLSLCFSGLNGTVFEPVCGRNGNHMSRKMFIVDNSLIDFV